MHILRAGKSTPRLHLPKGAFALYISGAYDTVSVRHQSLASPGCLHSNLSVFHQPTSQLCGNSKHIFGVWFQGENGYALSLH